MAAPAYTTMAAPAYTTMAAAPQYTTMAAPAYTTMAAPAVEYVSAAPQYVSAAPVVEYATAATMAPYGGFGTMVAAPLQFGTTQFQATLPPATSMIAYPGGATAMQGPFAFTAGAAYTGAPEKIED